MNLVTAVADAFLDRAPLVALTGQADLERMHKESHQYIDLVELLRPITKWNARVASPEIIPEVVRKAFKVAESEKPGATHLELPEDVMAAPLDAAPLPRRRPVEPEPAARELLKAADLIRNAINPVALAGNGVVRAGARAGAARVLPRDRHRGRRDVHGQGRCSTTPTPRRWAPSGCSRATTRWPASRTPTWSSPSATTSSSTRPSTGTRGATRRSSSSTPQAAEIDEYFTPEVELIGDIYHVLTRLAEECRDVPHSGGSQRLRDVVLGRFEAGQGRRRLPDAAPARAVGDPPGARAARTSSSPTSGCTSCGSAACSRPMSPTPC